MYVQEELATLQPYGSHHPLTIIMHSHWSGGGGGGGGGGGWRWVGGLVHSTHGRDSNIGSNPSMVYQVLG